MLNIVEATSMGYIFHAQLYAFNVNHRKLGAIDLEKLSRLRTSILSAKPWPKTQPPGLLSS